MKTEMKYGLIIALASAIWLIAQDAAGLHDKYIQYLSVAGWIGNIIPVVGLFLAIKEKRNKEYNGYIVYGQCVKTGLLASLVNGALTAVFQIIFFLFINPNFTSNILDYQREKMAESGLDANKIEIAMSAANFMSSPYMMTFFALLGTIISGLIITLILGAILKKNPPSDIELTQA